MFVDKSVLEQALEALEYENSWHEIFKVRPYASTVDAITALRAALAQQDEPVESVARECSDPMCACRGGPCAECEEGEREKEIEDLRSSLYFYQRRCEALQSWQSKMRDPERTIVCDILANGKTLDPAFAGDRYTEPPKQAEPVMSSSSEEVNCIPQESQDQEIMNYGSIDFGFTFVGLPLTDGDKRLASLLTRALGNDHPAFDDLVSLFFAARGRASNQ